MSCFVCSHTHLLSLSFPVLHYLHLCVVRVYPLFPLQWKWPTQCQSVTLYPCRIVLCSMISPRRHDSEVSVQGVVLWTPQRALIIWVELWVRSWLTAEKHQSTWAPVYTSWVLFCTAGTDERGRRVRFVVRRDQVLFSRCLCFYGLGGGQWLVAPQLLYKRVWEQ